MLAAGSKGKGEQKDDKGIVSGHAYSIHSVYKYKEDTLVQVRNPWGSFEYKGKYKEGEDNPVWQDQALCSLVKYHDKDDGMFLMTVEELQNNFDSINVCLVRPNYKV